MADPLDGFCKTKFWDINLTWYTTTPDFTPCFQNTLLVWVPFGALLLGLPYEIYQQRKPGKGKIPWNVYIITKLFFMVALFGLQLTELIWKFLYYDSDQLSPDEISSNVICLVSYFIVTVLIITGRKNGLQSSMLLFYFWLFDFLGALIVYYSNITNLINQPEIRDVTILGIKLALAPVVLLQFLLTFISDQLPENLRYTITENICPEEQSSYFSQIVFGWLDVLLLRGYKTPFKQNDLWKLGNEHTSSTIVKEFDYYWNKEIQKAEASGWDVTNKEQNKKDGVYEPAFMIALIRCYWPSFVFAAFQKTVSDVLSFASPLMLNLIISHVSSDEPLWKGIFYAIVVFCANELQSLFLSQYFIRMYVIAMKIRMSIISAVYRKALKISNKERQESTVGEIVNLMSIDTQRFVDLMPYLIMLYSAPIQITLALYFLSDVLGVSVVAGVVVMILMAPANAVIATVSRKLQVLDMKFKDERTKLMNEILNGIKVLKLYAWELPFGEMVRKIRDKEVTVLRTMAYYMAGITFLWTCAPFLVALASFTMYVLIDERNVLTANVAFVSISLFNLLRFPLNMLPSLITGLIQVSVSIKRINKFLRGEELDEKDITHQRLGDDAVVVENGEFSWGSDEVKSTLTNVNLSVPKGKLVAIVGQVGAGKSSLISAILGELNKKKGSVNVQGSVAYVPQQAWIQNASVRDNILMYKPYDSKFYEEVLTVCALKSDLEILPGGDQTEIGEKGINLSGGQKQRVSVARAVYHKSDVYLFDDPLSAVDAHVGKYMFDKVIGPDGILKSKTRVFVTNSITYLPQCDSVVVLKNGGISEIGTYQQLLSAKGAFSEFLTQYLSQEGDDLDEDVLGQLDDILSKVPVSPELQKQLSKRLSESESESVFSKSSDHSTRRKRSSSHRRMSEKSVTPKKADKQKLIQDEGMETAEVKIEIYLAYVKQIGWVMGLIIITFWIMSQASSVGSNVWLSEWSNDPLLPDGTVDKSLRDMRLGVYGALGIAQGIGIMIGAFGLAYGSMKASTHLHNQMLDCVLKSPMSYFDTTPIGRIVNRFSKDVNTMDVNLSMNFRGWLLTVMQVISVIIVDAIKTPIIIVILVPAAVIYYFVQKVYIATSRQLKRLESVTRSPIYVHFSESVTGASSIRAYGVQNIFIEEINKRVDTNMVSYYPSIAANRWLAVRLEFVGNIIVLFAALFAVLSGDLLDPGSVGLSVSYAMSITSSLNWMVRMSSELETNIVSVERILEYSELEPEAEWNNDHIRGKQAWPENGKIEFSSYKTKYRAGLDLVLKGIDCSIQPGEKIGICGRTGAGKSSLTLALFRIIEAQGGSINIDDVNISKLGLHDLRSRLTIIPQDPVLFSGNLRENLDPFSIKSDRELWSALEHAHLKTFVSGLTDGLQHNVAEGGENFSVGQRQLICLARALLRKTKILVLDEATAAVDLETDDLIQMTIKEEFADCTILTIAHRLNTIMDSSRVLVLDQGLIAEFETPENLLQNKKSMFYGMAQDAGLV